MNRNWLWPVIGLGGIITAIVLPALWTDAHVLLDSEEGTFTLAHALGIAIMFSTPYLINAFFPFLLPKIDVKLCNIDSKKGMSIIYLCPIACIILPLFFPPPTEESIKTSKSDETVMAG
jgi:hypothetical protein